MTLLQLGIGTVNDVVDAPRDAGRKPGKPIPAGLVTDSAAQRLAAGLFLAGTALAASVSIPLGFLAGVVIAIGLAYDLGLKGTPWSWLPFAVGIPILPVFGWLGATGTLHPSFAILLPAAVAAGAALAIGNALVDVERDRAASVSSIAIALGAQSADRLTVVLLTIVALAAVASAVLAGGKPLVIAVLALVGAVPVAAAWHARQGSSSLRERAWQLEAIGLAILAVVWIAGLVGDLSA